MDITGSYLGRIKKWVSDLLATHTAISNAHHTPTVKYTDNEAKAALENSDPTFTTCKVSNLNEGEITFSNSLHQIITDNALFWDNVNKRLGINTQTPADKIHLHDGIFRITSAAINAYLFRGFTNGGPTDSLGIAIYDSTDTNAPYLWIAVAGSSWGGPTGKIVFASHKNVGTVKDIWIYANDNLVPSSPNLLIEANTNRVCIGGTTPTAKLDINSDILRLRTAKTPATAGAAGNTGDMCWDTNYIYICVAANTWKRVSITTW